MKRGRLNLSYLYIAPAVLGCIAFTFLPIAYLIYLSLNKVNMLSGQFTMIGLDNYTNIIDDSSFRTALGNTFMYTLLVVVLSVTLALLLAVFLNRSTKLHFLVQSIVFTPHIIPLVSASMLFMWMMEPDVGLLNYILKFFGVAPINWLGDPKMAMTSMIIVSIWKVLGYNTLILMAGLQGIPKEIYESANLDYSNGIKTFVSITVPMLSPSIFFLIITNTLSSFQVFDSISIMTQGGPLGSTNVLVYWIYQMGFEFFHMGKAAAGAVVLLLIVIILTCLNFKLLSKKVHYQ